MLMSNPYFSVTPSGELPNQDSYLLATCNNQVLLKEANGTYFLPRLSEVVLPDSFKAFHLATLANESIFSNRPEAELAIATSGSLQYHPFSVFRQMTPENAFILTSCHHLWNWYRTHRFCGCCGKPNMPDQKERALRCTECGHVSYPVICPAVITAITCGDQILLAQNAMRTYRHPSLIAGYVEVGESLQHAVAREAMEEVGLQVSDIRFVGDQPWGISGSHMFAFTAHADCNAPLILQESEIAEAGWVHRSELQTPETIMSVAAELIERFRTNQL